MSKFVLLICVTLVLVYSISASGHITEIVVGDDMADVAKSNSVDPIPPEDASDVCHVEFQVMKRVMGRCVKLGRNSKGCVAGTYLHPFHPECL